MSAASADNAGRWDEGGCHCGGARCLDDGYDFREIEVFGGQHWEDNVGSIT